MLFGGGWLLLDSPLVDEFEVAEVGGVAGGVVGGDDGFAVGVGVVEVEGEVGGDLVVRADVGDGGEAGVACGGAAGKAEDEVVVGSSTLVPEIAAGGELEEVEVGAELEVLEGGVDDLGELVGAVHEVVEGEAGVGAGGGEDLEEGVVDGVGVVVVAGSAEDSTSQPGLGVEGGEAVAGLGGEGSGVLGEEAPVAVLEDTPEEGVELAGASGEGGDEVGSVGTDADVFVVGLTGGEGAVVGLGEAGAAIVVVDGEDSPEEVVAEVGFGEGEVLEVDVELGVGVHVEDSLNGSAGHGGEVPGGFAVVGVEAVEAALTDGEAEVADEALGDAVGL